MGFVNSYENEIMADAYAKLEFPGTYYLAYRDFPAIFKEHIKGTQAVDFGCGAGRSTRFLQKTGFQAVGVDISPDMIKKAREIDPHGDYRLIEDGDFSQFDSRSFDLALSAFTFDNIPTMERKVKILQNMSDLLKDDGRIVNLVSTPEMYYYEWASFSTRDFPQNRTAQSGDIVKIINTDIEDNRPVDDIIWPHESYRETYHAAGLEIEKTYKPLAREDEPYEWVNETRIAPWVIYVLKKIL